MNKKKYTFIIVVFCSFFGFSQNADIIEAINENALEITNSNPIVDLEKNEVWDKVFKNVRVFGFGEATHGTKEFSNLKIKFFKYLVKHEGVRNFAIEASYGNCISINNYVKEEDRNPMELLDEIGLWIWKNEEVLALIKWMKSYNLEKTESEQLNFYGIDIMDCSRSAKIMTEYLKDSSIENKAMHLDILSRYTSINKSEQLKNKILKKDLNAMSQLKEIVKQSNDPRKDFYLSLQNSIVQYINFRLDYSQETRDKGMAENINQILASSGNDSKVFVWSHNFHIKKNKITYTNDFAMGHFLKEKYGNQYYSLGFDFATGAFNAYNIKNKIIEKFSIPEPMRNTSSELFNESFLDCFFLDFNSTSKIGIIDDYINSNVIYRGIGSTYSPKMIEKEKLKNAYDGIIFVRNTEASSLLKN